MTDKPKRITDGPLRPAVAADRIHVLLRDQRARLDAAEREVVDADHVKVMKIAARVPEKERGTLRKILASMSIEFPSDDPDGELIDMDQDGVERDGVSVDSEGSAAAPVMMSANHVEDQTLPRGAADYVPSPVAQAARTGRR